MYIYKLMYSYIKIMLLLLLHINISKTHSYTNDSEYY